MRKYWFPWKTSFPGSLKAGIVLRTVTGCFLKFSINKVIYSYNCFKQIRIVIYLHTVLTVIVEKRPISLFDWTVHYSEIASYAWNLTTPLFGWIMFHTTLPSICFPLSYNVPLVKKNSTKRLGSLVSYKKKNNNISVRGLNPGSQDSIKALPMVHPWRFVTRLVETQ